MRDAESGSQPRSPLPNGHGHVTAIKITGSQSSNTVITFLLCERGALHKPVLYLSHFFKRHRQEYYDKLQAVRDAGDWESWLTFFLMVLRR
jgi:hypothetical protein